MGYQIRVKICGITHVDDLEAAIEAGADAIGLNFHPPSPRSVSVDAARSLLANLPPFLDPVGVFVRQPLTQLRELLDRLGRIRTVQMHGGGYEAADPFPYRYVPAFQIKDVADLDAVVRYLDTCRQAHWSPSAILLDGHAAGLTGGTGQVAPWSLLERFRPGVPVLLAGGLTPENVAEAIACVRPWGVDVASGVESSPGRKDAAKMRAFVELARRAALDAS